MDLGLTGRTAFVVGGSGYLGRAIARVLVAEGAHVVLGGRDAGRLEETRAPLGEAASTIELDTRSAESAAAAVAAILDRRGRLDILVNTAAPPAHLLDPERDLDAEQLREAIDAKALGYLRVAEPAARAMREAGYGRIVHIGGQLARLTRSATAAARNAVVDIVSKTLADRLAGTGVTVNVVHPAAVVDHPSPEVEPGNGGPSSPEQIAALVAFLASGPAGAISGEAIAVGHRVRGMQ